MAKNKAKSTKVEKHKGNIVYGTYSVEEVLSKRVAIGTKDKDSHVKFGEHEVNMNSLRYQIFEESIKCAVCGRVATHMKLETRSNPRPHMNMYARDVDGNEILMTKGNAKHPNGHQTTCEPCMNKWSAELQRERNAQQKASREAAVQADA